MTKNEECLTVAVLDQNGDVVGKTYPKRAKGLVKKGRVQFVSDNQIRLNNTDPTYEYTEEFKMDNGNVNIKETIPQKNYIFFDPKKWQKHPDVEASVADRFFIDSVFGDGLTEVYSLGNWGSRWSEITCGMLMLEKNTEYHFVFWLNGGENDNKNEICQCQIMFGNNSLSILKSEWDQKLVYKLNRSYLKPLKRYQGWELYDIPFVTEDKDYTQIRFVAQYAPMTVMAAKEPEKYSELEETTDEFADIRPQRHNIIFEDGWPTDKWYATARLKGSDSAENQAGWNLPGPHFDHMVQISGEKLDLDEITETIAERIDVDEIAETIAGNINMDEIMESVAEKINSDDIVSNIVDNIDYDSIGDRVASLIAAKMAGSE